MKPYACGIVCLALVLNCGLAAVGADTGPGVREYIANAEVIEVIQAEMPASAGSFPAPQDKQRVRVKEVLKGVDTAQEFLLPRETLKPGQRALLLFHYQLPPHYEPSLETSIEAEPEFSVWPMDAVENVDVYAGCYAPGERYPAGSISTAS